MSAWAVLAAAVYAGDTPEFRRATQDAERIRTLVDQGALPQAALNEAAQAVEAATLQAVLRRTLYGELTVEQLTEAQAAEMVDAAARLLLQQQDRVDRTRRLIEAGAAPPTSLTPVLEELDARRRTHDLALNRAALLRQLAEMARAEEAVEERLELSPVTPFKPSERFDGGGVFHPGHLRAITTAYLAQFSRPLPISANGDTATHRAMGFDHRGRVDVALNPDSTEGAWLLRLLEQMGVPYHAFRVSIAGRSTAPHVHIGPPSLRLRRAD